MYAFKKFRNGKLIEGDGASVRRIMNATGAITRSVGKSVKRRAGRAMSNHKTLFSTQKSTKKGETWNWPRLSR
jgi:hypothetical protein